MIFFWKLPIHRPITRVEYLIDDFLTGLWYKLIYPLYYTRLHYWVLDPHGQFYTLCLAMVLGAAVWSLISHAASKKTVRAARSTALKNLDRNDEKDGVVAKTSNVVYTVKTTPSPPRHVPALHTNTSMSAHQRGNADRTGRISTPGYQTPFDIKTHADNFARLATDAPVNYETLQETGMLDEEGTPTKKWAKKQVRFGPGGGMGKGKEKVAGLKEKKKEPMAYWENDVKRKGGRAVRTMLERGGEDVVVYGWA